ncbi:DgyrCDS9439 [Dimorphilus gyrociliatus]|uniref:DgyrCDS9439 n=1 Tax=Dimorphilus gyrociliatus TaxID=2664684 RepID=A0A7I8VYB2_9ANNE|nr:DgyrCDS9439 [Dimorphilus gyrociliatus]
MTSESSEEKNLSLDSPKETSAVLSTSLENSFSDVPRSETNRNFTLNILSTETTVSLTSTFTNSAESSQIPQVSSNETLELTQTLTKEEGISSISHDEKSKSDDITIVPTNLMSDFNNTIFNSTYLGQTDNLKTSTNDSDNYFSTTVFAGETDLSNVNLTETIKPELNISSSTYLGINATASYYELSESSSENISFFLNSLSSINEKTLSTYFQENSTIFTSINNDSTAYSTIDSSSAIPSSINSSLTVNETKLEVDETSISTYSETKNETQSKVSNGGTNETFTTIHSEESSASLNSNEENITLITTAHTDTLKEIYSTFIQNSTANNIVTSILEESSVIEPSFSTGITDKPPSVNYSLYSTQADGESTIPSEINSSYVAEFSTNGAEENLSSLMPNESSIIINSTILSSTQENKTWLSPSYQSDFAFNSSLVYSDILAGNSPSLTSIYTNNFNNATSFIEENSNPSEFITNGTLSMNEIVSSTFEKEETSSLVPLKTTFFEESSLFGIDTDRNQTSLFRSTAGNESLNTDHEANSTQLIANDTMSEIYTVTTILDEETTTILSTIYNNSESSTFPMLSTNIVPESLSSITPSSVVPENTMSTPNLLISDSLTEFNTTFEPTTLPSTNPTLSFNETLKNHWVYTVLKIPVTVDVENSSFISSMELKFAKLYDCAWKRRFHGLTTSCHGRRKRAATFNNITLQILNITRGVNEESTTFVYYLQRGLHRPVEATLAVSLIHDLRDQEIALVLGYEVEVKAGIYYVESKPKEEDKKLWIIGAAIGGLFGLIGIVWLTICIYCRCKTLPKKIRYPPPPDPEAAHYRRPEKFEIFPTKIIPIENENKQELANVIYNTDNKSNKKHLQYKKAEEAPEEDQISMGKDNRQLLDLSLPVNTHSKRNEGVFTSDENNETAGISNTSSKKRGKKKKKRLSPIKLYSVVTPIKISAIKQHNVPDDDSESINQSLKERFEEENERNKERMRKMFAKEKLPPINKPKAKRKRKKKVDKTSEEYDMRNFPAVEAIAPSIEKAKQQELLQSDEENNDWLKAHSLVDNALSIITNSTDNENIHKPNGHLDHAPEDKVDFRPLRALPGMIETPIVQTRSPDATFTTKNYNIGRAEKGDDEIDIAQRVVTRGATAPVLASIKYELTRLARDSDTKV